MLSVLTASLKVLSICQNWLARTIPVIMRISLLIKLSSQIPNSMHEGNGASTKTLKKKALFIVKMTGLAMIWPANSDFWKAPLGSKRCSLYWGRGENQNTAINSLKLGKNVKTGTLWSMQGNKIIPWVPETGTQGKEQRVKYRTCICLCNLLPQVQI